MSRIFLRIFFCGTWFLLAGTSVTHAAFINYSESTGSIRAGGIIDGAPSTTCYSDSADLPAGSTAALSASVSGNALAQCQQNFGSSANGTISALALWGFSIEGTLSTYVIDNDEPDAANVGDVQRRALFQVIAPTAVDFVVEWSGCSGCSGTPQFGNSFFLQRWAIDGSVARSLFIDQYSASLGDGSEGQASVRINERAEGSAIYEQQEFFYDDGPQLFSYRLDLLPGDYEVRMRSYGASQSEPTDGTMHNRVSLTAVPLPPALLLFASALGLVGSRKWGRTAIS